MKVPCSAAQVPVLIVGGGVVGLSASLFLAAQGIRSMLVERHPGTSIHPRARGVNGRTMELLRELGLEGAVRAASVKLGPSVGIYSGSTLVQAIEKMGDGGWLLRRMRRRGTRGQPTRRSPTGPCRCTQDELEPVLLETARVRGVEAHFSTELVDVDQDAGGVTATLLDRVSGTRRTVRSEFLIAADGARSPMRTRLQIPQSGSGALSHQLNLYFRADLGALVKGREFSMCLVERDGRRGLFASINNTDLWVLHVSYHPDRGEQPEDFPPERCVALIRDAVGIPDLAVELKGALPWVSAVRIAERYREGRIFLAGDAAHVMPPWGGFGANSGIQDAHNLAWKLSAVLAGSAGPALLDTYAQERRPVAAEVGELAGSMNDAQGLMTIKKGLAQLWSMRKVFPYLTVGYGYASSAIALEPGPAPGPGTRELGGRPGTRAPHLWVEREGNRISSLDLFGRGFVLLAGSHGGAWREAAGSAAKRLGIPLEILQMGVELGVPKGSWHRAYGVSSSGASLIRPDGFVAWRAAGKTADPARLLTRVLSALLSRDDAQTLVQAA